MSLPETLSSPLPDEIYDEMRRAAGVLLRRDRPGHTLQATALVHEAWLRLADSTEDWESQGHFLAVAARAMRFVLADHARGHHAQKRGGGRRRVTLSDDIGLGVVDGVVEVLALEEALSKLEQLHERQARVAEMRFLGGLTIEECANVLGVSHGTVEADWRLARAWLRRELSDEAA